MKVNFAFLLEMKVPEIGRRVESHAMSSAVVGHHEYSGPKSAQSATSSLEHYMVLSTEELFRIWIFLQTSKF